VKERFLIKTLLKLAGVVWPKNQRSRCRLSFRAGADVHPAIPLVLEMKKANVHSAQQEQGYFAVF
jgi:hypothetical protein